MSHQLDYIQFQQLVDWILDDHKKYGTVRAKQMAYTDRATPHKNKLQLLARR